MLGEITGLVRATWFPVHSEFALFHSISNPVESNVHGFGSLCFDCVVGDSCSGGVVCLDWCWAQLLVAHFFEGVSDGVAFLSVSEEGAEFGFSGGGHNLLENLAKYVDWSVERWRRCFWARIILTI